MLVSVVLAAPVWGDEQESTVRRPATPLTIDRLLILQLVGRRKGEQDN
jgi:hypothetical protein